MKKPILVFSHDAGGAEVLAALIARAPESERTKFRFCLDGPAETIFRKKFGENLTRFSVNDLSSLSPLDWGVVASTSWKANLERSALSEAHRLGFHTASVLDHWTNYRERFLSNEFWNAIPGNWETFLPSEVWVVDEYAEKMALKLGFPADRVKRKPNAYVEDCVVAVRAAEKKRADNEAPESGVPSKKFLNLLYISEPVRDNLISTYGDANYWGFTEFDLLKNLTDAMEYAGTKMRVTFRLHPREDTEKYREFFNAHSSVKPSYPKETPLTEDLAATDWVAGGESMGLVIAAAAGKRVFSLIPAAAKKPCVLPQKDIERQIQLAEVLRREWKD